MNKKLRVSKKRRKEKMRLNCKAAKMEKALKRVLHEVNKKRKEKGWAKLMPLTKEEQSRRYMGNCSEVIEHFKNKNKVSNSELRYYFTKTKEVIKVWKMLDLGPIEQYEIDHVNALC